MKLLYSALICLFFNVLLSAQNTDLPRYATEQELKVQQLTTSDGPAERITGIENPPPQPVRTMAEWEELQALLITWNGQSTILSEIVRAARLECKVIIACSTQQTVDQAKSTLTSKGIDITSNVEFVIAPNNSIWVRDYGPNSVYANEVDSLYLIDWIYNRPRPLDDALPVKIAEHMGIPLYSTTAAPADLVNTGGNFMSDGNGTAFASSLILNENEAGNPYNVSVKTEGQIDAILQDYMGISRYIKMDKLPYDVIHHIDMHMKLLDEETLLVGQYPDGIADGPQIEANIQYVLSNFKSTFNEPYKVVRIPMPPGTNGTYPHNGGPYRTYANAVFVNKTVIVPFYQQKYDTTAQRIWEAAMPGYKVVGINCNAIIGSLGAIHCITKEIGVADPLRIVHQELPCQDNFASPGAYTVSASVQHRSGISEATLHYTADPAGSNWKSVSMHQGIVPDDNWFAGIPAQPEGSTVRYYIEANAVSGKNLTRPLTAPQGYWSFCVEKTSGIPQPTPAELLDIYPNPASALTVLPVRAEQPTQGSLSVFNALGQRVQTVFAGAFPAGESNHFLDASPLAAGTYFVELQTPQQVTMRKLVVH
jgi:agmatine deiminase